MPDPYGVKIEGLDKVIEGMNDVPRAYPRIVEVSFMKLGQRVIRFCVDELEDVRYTGALARSFVSDIDAHLGQLRVLPTAKHRFFVRWGTRPHWAPIGPLTNWARWKLGNENAAYPVQRSIAAHGTSMYQLRKRGTKANPWPVRVVGRNDFRGALDDAGQEIGDNMGAIAVGGGANFI